MTSESIKDKVLEELVYFSQNLGMEKKIFFHEHVLVTESDDGDDEKHPDVFQPENRLNGFHDAKFFVTLSQLSDLMKALEGEGQLGFETLKDI